MWQKEATWKAAQKRKREEVPSEHLHKVDDKLHSMEDKLLAEKDKFYAWDIGLASRRGIVWGSDSVTHRTVFIPSCHKREAHPKPKIQKRKTVEPVSSSPRTASEELQIEETITLYSVLSPLVMDVAEVEKEKLNKGKERKSTKIQGKVDTMTGRGDKVVKEGQGHHSRQQVYNEEVEEEKQKKKAREKEKKEEEEERKKTEVKMRLLQLAVEEDKSSKKSGLSSHRLPSSVNIKNDIVKH